MTPQQWSFYIHIVRGEGPGQLLRRALERPMMWTPTARGSVGLRRPVRWRRTRSPWSGGHKWRRAMYDAANVGWHSNVSVHIFWRCSKLDAILLADLSFVRIVGGLTFSSVLKVLTKKHTTHLSLFLLFTVIFSKHSPFPCSELYTQNDWFGLFSSCSSFSTLILTNKANLPVLKNHTKNV